jgi:hypothetical protein
MVKRWVIYYLWHDQWTIAKRADSFITFEQAAENNRCWIIQNGTEQDIQRFIEREFQNRPGVDQVEWDNNTCKHTCLGLVLEYRYHEYV